QYVVWGGEAQIYNTPAHLQTFPGIAVLLSPVAWLADSLHLSESFPLNLNHPSAWLLLGPAQYLCGGFLLLPIDSLAKRLQVGVKRRLLLMLCVSVLVWTSLALWGHPEDALALGVSLVGLMAALDGSWLRVGIYFGLAIAIQPLVLLVLPIAIAYVPFRIWPKLGAVIALPSTILLLPPLIQEWGPTTYILLKQPNFPLRNHPTPWLSLAPIVKPGYYAVLKFAKLVKLKNGQHTLEEISRRAHVVAVVGAGPGRLIAIFIAISIGVVVAKLRPPLAQVLWITALALSLRCIFEPVIVPYYLLPGLAVAMVVATRASRIRMLLALTMAVGCALLSYHYQSPWAYFSTMTCTLALALGFAKPTSSNEATPHEGPASLSVT
ncbi:MAG: hypothetical protein HKL85_01775, partial [Acidimicrobiaceae bacterium]|nr:hypothetical protein [Acidimicrobiaceae bacterium]